MDPNFENSLGNGPWVSDWSDEQVKGCLRGQQGWKTGEKKTNFGVN